jgi:hypothetical protein
MKAILIFGAVAMFVLIGASMMNKPQSAADAAATDQATYRARLAENVQNEHAYALAHDRIKACSYARAANADSRLLGEPETMDVSTCPTE